MVPLSAQQEFFHFVTACLGAVAGAAAADGKGGIFVCGTSCSIKAAADKKPPMQSAQMHKETDRYFGMHTFDEISKT